MAEISDQLIVETFTCSCQQKIKFLVTGDHRPLTEHEKELLTQNNIFIVSKGQKIPCPHCKGVITIV